MPCNFRSACRHRLNSADISKLFEDYRYHFSTYCANFKREISESSFQGDASRLRLYKRPRKCVINMYDMTIYIAAHVKRKWYVVAARLLDSVDAPLRFSARRRNALSSYTNARVYSYKGPGRDVHTGAPARSKSRQNFASGVFNSTLYGDRRVPVYRACKTRAGCTEKCGRKLEK